MNGEWKTIDMPTVYGGSLSVTAYCDETWGLSEAPPEMESPEEASWCVVDLSTASVSFMVGSMEDGMRIVDLANQYELAYHHEDGVHEMIMLCNHILDNDINAYVPKPTGDGSPRLVTIQEVLFDVFLRSFSASANGNSEKE